MIKFSKSEIEYIKNTFKRYQNINIDAIEDEYFKEHFFNLDKSIFEQIEEVLKNIRGAAT